MRHPTQKIENGMLLGLRVIGAQFIKVFKDFRDTTIQLSFFIEIVESLLIFEFLEHKRFKNNEKNSSP